MFIANIEPHPGGEDLLKRGAISVVTSRCAVRSIQKVEVARLDISGRQTTAYQRYKGLQHGMFSDQRETCFKDHWSYCASQWKDNLSSGVPAPDKDVLNADSW